MIPEVINEWNTISAASTNIILMPVKWETSTTPLLGGRPQAIINDQIVEDADLLVGVFWTRLGTNTGEAVSGTTEEIEQFVKAEKPVMLYFSQSPIEPDKLDITQFTALKKFKDSMRLRGLTETYNGLTDFRQKFTRQLALNLNNLIDSLLEQEKAKGREPSKKVKTIKKAAVENLTQLSSEGADLYLTKAIHETSREDGWAKLPALASYLSRYTPVDYREMGFDKLKPYLESTDMFEFNALSKTDIEIRLKNV